MMPPGGPANGAGPGQRAEMPEDWLQFSYKVTPCNKPFAHDWSSCPCSHAGERAARRDPRAVPYRSIACPYAKRRIPCPDGDQCLNAHNLYEYWLHPDRFKTEICQHGQCCTRPVCFFAHTAEEIRALPPGLPPAELCWGTGASQRSAAQRFSASRSGAVVAAAAMGGAGVGGFVEPAVWGQAAAAGGGGGVRQRFSAVQAAAGAPHAQAALGAAVPGMGGALILGEPPHGHAGALSGLLLQPAAYQQAAGAMLGGGAVGGAPMMLVGSSSNGGGSGRAGAGASAAAGGAPAGLPAGAYAGAFGGAAAYWAGPAPGGAGRQAAVAPGGVAAGMYFGALQPSSPQLVYGSGQQLLQQVALQQQQQQQQQQHQHQHQHQ
ncbi:hypothetical protein Rsub_01653 [Raphidocelis subcapitata]|uniref:C3H1-type domain-containing protein n=1 Tax=Raphidocelis subcapitata TaxID=307507 RepID=A0A2V0NQ86_9CHLO|nr:hypothetical protein Rsub_01653 [Raphidocelis subcapitata]|eukprot:GBF88752.1 hypothetical protein Rsub_01653 [Raphidocelis subcapitata]